jgi:Domain of unknown function (DUF4365)
MLGQRGEDAVCYLLQRVLHAEVQRPRKDIGLDGYVTFKPFQSSAPLNFTFQVKTGNSFAKKMKSGDWKITRNVKKKDLEYWRHAVPPVIFIWVNPDEGFRAYWHIITMQTGEQFIIPKNKYITPCTRSDLILNLSNYQRWQGKDKEFKLFIPPLSENIREKAKLFYKRISKEQFPINPVLGPVRISSHGWRHLTCQRRKDRDIFSSFLLLPSLRSIIEKPVEKPRIRRLTSFSNLADDRIIHPRLITFENNITFTGGQEMNIFLVLKEVISFHKNWFADITKDISRDVMFESLYAKK